ncbi:MAG: helix-turn-helix transcriptional regulator [Bdellovibrionota bacterium]
MNAVTGRIAKFLTDRRLRSHLSLEQCADYLGISIEEFSSYESATLEIPLIDMVALSNLFNIPPTELIEFVGEVVLDVDPESGLIFSRHG